MNDRHTITIDLERVADELRRVDVHVDAATAALSRADRVELVRAIAAGLVALELEEGDDEDTRGSLAIELLNEAIEDMLEERLFTGASAACQPELTEEEERAAIEKLGSSQLGRLGATINPKPEESNDGR